MEFQNNYPCVFLHGLMGFGEEDTVEKHFAYFGFANTTFFQHMEEKGYECYHPNIGPVNSAWDRVCIIWAYLFGGRVADFLADRFLSEKIYNGVYGKIDGLYQLYQFIQKITVPMGIAYDEHLFHDTTFSSLSLSRIRRRAFPR